MCLHLRLTPARAAFARPGPHATAFPDVNAPMQPSDSLAPFGRRSGRPSPAAYPGAGLVLHRRTAAPRNRYDAGDISIPAPLPPAPSRGETRASQVPGPSSFARAAVLDPAGCDAPLAPLTVRSPSPSGPPRPSAPGMHSISGLSYPRPTRSRAYASPKPLPSPAQGSLPAGRAHPWPGGVRTRWMTNKVSWCHRIRQSSSTSLTWSHRRRESTRAETSGVPPYKTSRHPHESAHWCSVNAAPRFRRSD